MSGCGPGGTSLGSSRWDSHVGRLSCSPSPSKPGRMDRWPGARTLAGRHRNSRARQCGTAAECHLRVTTIVVVAVIHIYYSTLTVICECPLVSLAKRNAAGDVRRLWLWGAPSGPGQPVTARNTGANRTRWSRNSSRMLPVGPCRFLATMISVLFRGYTCPGMGLSPVVPGGVEFLPVDEGQQVDILPGEAAIPQAGERRPGMGRSSTIRLILEQRITATSTSQASAFGPRDIPVIPCTRFTGPPQPVYLTVRRSVSR